MADKPTYTLDGPGDGPVVHITGDDAAEMFLLLLDCARYFEKFHYDTGMKLKVRIGAFCDQLIIPPDQRHETKQ